MNKAISDIQKPHRLLMLYMPNPDKRGYQPHPGHKPHAILLARASPRTIAAATLRAAFGSCS